MREWKCGLCALALIFSPLGLASLTPPLSLPSAQVMPKGVRNVNLKGIIAQGTAKYNNWGQREVLADPFFTSLDFATIKEGTLDPLDLASIQSKMDKLGVSDQDSFGSTMGMVNVKAHVTVPVLAYGLTENITVAIAVPIAQSSLAVNTGVVQQNRALYQAFRQELQASGVSVKLQELDQKLADPVNYKIADYNYQPLQNENSTKLGDIKLVAKYKSFDHNDHVITLTTNFSLPTAKQEDIDKVIDLGGGDGQLDWGLAVNHDFRLNEQWSLSSELGHTIQFADTLAQRIPERYDSSLSPDKDENTQRKLGNMMIAHTALKWRHQGISAGLSYALQYKQKDSYSGNVFSERRYRWLEQSTVQNMQTISASIGYDTITLYRQGKFPAPLAVSLGHSRVLSGKNVVVDPMTTFDLALFF
jgi:hypothetical protein